MNIESDRKDPIGAISQAYEDLLSRKENGESSALPESVLRRLSQDFFKGIESKISNN